VPVVSNTIDPAFSGGNILAIATVTIGIQGTSPGSAICFISDNGTRMQQGMESSIPAGQTITMPVVAGISNQGGSQSISLVCGASSGSPEETVDFANLTVQADG
jgi:hypothetical protein